MALVIHRLEHRLLPTSVWAEWTWQDLGLTSSTPAKTAGRQVFLPHLSLLVQQSDLTHVSSEPLRAEERRVGFIVLIFTPLIALCIYNKMDK